MLRLWRELLVPGAAVDSFVLKGRARVSLLVHNGSIDGQEASIYMFGEEDYSAKKVSRKGAGMSFINLPQVRPPHTPSCSRKGGCVGSDYARP